MIGNSQMLNLPVSEAIILFQGDNYTVPQGKILQGVSSNLGVNGNPMFRLSISSNNQTYVPVDVYNHPVYP